MHIPRILSLAALLAVVMAPSIGRACACGCGVFEVGDLSMFPDGKGWMVSLDYDYQAQNLNWSGNSRAPAENNSDKRLATHFVTADVQYMFNRSYCPFTNTSPATSWCRRCSSS